jgi:serine/threonine protein kinase
MLIRYVQDREIPFALKIFKELGSQTEIDFHNELTMLNTLSETSHPHITGHLASWTHRKKFYMLFPCAETNLGNFLRLQPHPELTNSNVRWLLSQLKGLAEGVRHIHILGPAGLGPDGLTADDPPPRKEGRSGFHHDLKPQNILVFAGDNLNGREPAISEVSLKISDFGAARINVILSQSGLGRSNFSPQHSALVRGDPVYSAPDYTLEHKTSRPYDIWSLGCVFLEVLLWTHGLSDSDLNDFDLERMRSHNSRSTKFWHEDDRGKIILKRAVVERLKQLQDHCQDRGVFKHLVRLTAKMLTITPKDRPKASDVCNDLEAMLIQAERDFKVPDFYRHDVLLHDEIAAPLTNEGTSRRPSIDERSIRAFENGLLQVQSKEQRRPRSPSLRQESEFRQKDEQNGDISQDSYRLSPILTKDILPGPGHSRSPSIAISDHDAPFPSAAIEQTNGSNGYVPQPLLGSHSTPIGPEDLARRARPRARSTDSHRSQSAP